MTEDELKLLRALRDGLANDHQVLMDKLIAGFERGPTGHVDRNDVAQRVPASESYYTDQSDDGTVPVYCFEVQP